MITGHMFDASSHNTAVQDKRTVCTKVPYVDNDMTNHTNYNWT